MVREFDRAQSNTTSTSLRSSFGARRGLQDRAGAESRGKGACHRQSRRSRREEEERPGRIFESPHGTGRTRRSVEADA